MLSEQMARSAGFPHFKLLDIFFKAAPRRVNRKRFERFVQGQAFIWP